VAVDFFLDPSRFPALTPGRVPRPRQLFDDLNDDREFSFLALAGLGLAIFVALGLRHSRTGRVLIAMRDNERAAQAVGLSLVRIRLLTFAISGALAAVAGALFAAQHRTVGASGYGVDASIQIFLMAVIGGLGSVSGVLTGAVYLASVQLFIPSPMVQQLASGAGVALILLFFPSGLGGAVYAARDAFLRRVALRDRIFVPSLLGELRSVDGVEQRVRLGARIESGSTAPRELTYVVPSSIAEAGRSQRGRGWIYG
jgi:branched-chain amino acid transport system permease protein